MSDIKGKVYKFAGCEARIVQKSDSLFLKAVFCGVADDPENLPRVSLFDALNGKERPVRTTLRADDIMKAIVSHDAYAATQATPEATWHIRDVALDLGPAKLRKAMMLCSRVSAQDLKDCEMTFIPAAKLKLG
jgi:hypothetical protein